MKRVLFIGHQFHTKTKSSQFFINFLSEAYDLTELYFNPDDIAGMREISQISRGDYDAVFVWQLDFLCSIFLSKGFVVICSPMLDGSYSMPAEYWRPIKEATFINFSLHMHEALLANGATSHYIKYFPEPSEVQAKHDGVNRGFFWRRRPEHGIDLELIWRIFGDTLDELHIHDCPDTEGGELFIPDELAEKVTVSNWFDEKSDLDGLLNDCNFFIAPRVAEGIGMAFLEAMARGMVVAAFDYPTHNEYISNGINGILFDFDSGGAGNIANTRDLGAAAYRTIMLGRETWQQDSQRVLSIIDGAISDDVSSVSYDLKAAIRLCEVFFTRSLEEYIDEIRAVLPVETVQECVIDPIYRRILTLSFKNNLRGLHYINGWSGKELGHRWISGLEASIQFRWGKEDHVHSIELTGLCVGENFALIKLNGDEVGEVKMSGELSSVSFPLPEGIVLRDGENDITICAREAWPIEGGARTVSLCINSISLFLAPTE